MSVGDRVAVLDAQARVRGRVDYVLDVSVPGMLHGRIYRSPMAHGLIRRLDLTRALRVPGVVAAVGGREVQEIPGITPYYGALVRDTPIVGLDRVRYIGEPLVGIAAVDIDAADEALSLIEVELEELTAVFDPRESLLADAPQIHHDGNLAASQSLVVGVPEEVLSTADVVVTDEFFTPAIHAVPLEPHVVVADATGEDLLIYSATQTPYVVRRELAAIFGLPPERVRVVVRTLGGGFGAKAYARIEPIAAVLSRRAGRPVRIVLTPGEEFVTGQRQASWVRMTTGTSRAGDLLAMRAECHFASGAYAENSLRIAKHAAYSAPGPYRTPNLAIEVRAAFTNTASCGPFRAPGTAQIQWARESHLEHVARTLGMDPVEFRLRNLAKSGDRFVLGGLVDHVHLPRLLAETTDAVWSGRTGVQQAIAARPGERVGTGYGVALKTTNTPSISEVDLMLERNGALSVSTSTVEIGQGARTVLAQIAAQQLEIGIDRVSISYPDTSVTPFDHGTASSRSTFSMGGAIEHAGRAIREQLLALVSDQLEISVGDLRIGDGAVHVLGAPDRSRSFTDIMERAGLEQISAHGSFTNTAIPDPVTGEPGSSTHYHQAAAMARVSVDTETGRTTLLDVRGAIFAGTVVNPTLAELQNEGNIIFGVGQALFEELIHDAGQLATVSLADYNIASFLDIPPRLGSMSLEDRAEPEFHGLGETLLPAVVPAITNAIANAIGTHVTQLPATPERVLVAFRALRTGESE